MIFQSGLPHLQFYSFLPMYFIEVNSLYMYSCILLVVSAKVCLAHGNAILSDCKCQKMPKYT